MYKSIWRNRINSRGYTLIEALFNFIVFALFLQLLIYIYAWMDQMDNSFLNNEHVAWELFVQDVQQYFMNVNKLYLYQGHGEKLEIGYVNSKKTMQIQRFNEIIRLQTDDKGYVPLLIGINSAKFTLNGNYLTIAAEFSSGLKKERTFFVQIYNE